MLRFITCVLFFLPLAATGLAAQEAAATPIALQQRTRVKQTVKFSSRSVSSSNRQHMLTSCRSNFSSV
jgi:hypothetical protein